MYSPVGQFQMMVRGFYSYTSWRLSRLYYEDSRSIEESVIR